MLQPGPAVVLVRHGETSWSRSGRHTSRTDVPLTAAGETQAKALGALLQGSSFDRVFTSPLQRATRTAELAGLVPYEIDEDLREWDYGAYEGLTTPEIQEREPGWSIWRGSCPSGEAAAEVTARADRVVWRVRTDPSARVALVGHGHLLRALTARWLDQPVASGRFFALGTGAVCELGWERDVPVVRRWNLTAG